MNRDYNDYTYMWWKDGFNKGDKEMLFQTGRYGLSVQTVSGEINRLGRITAPARAEEVMRADNSAVLSLPGLLQPIRRAHKRRIHARRGAGFYRPGRAGGFPHT